MGLPKFSSAGHSPSLRKILASRYSNPPHDTSPHCFIFTNLARFIAFF
ncbi:hypothetical protein CAMSH0001_0536 [Campylobacter showae RM3277]|uniref:Uncharacterized protein n=1 Tax=Campylobacter showae RM3277 TaxID=553219 RepID=C6RFN0_9BACT|nr:hypothetical protein CAMSH0001_0536 [Campylobacter showae RM3277]